MSSRFTPRFEDLPEALPIFPLGGTILLPGRQLPLNIFEPRYLNMTLDVLGGSRMIGMVQPAPAATRSGGDPVRRIGCAGRITSFSESGDGRLMIVLTGVCRFAIAEELESHHGYRIVTPDWSDFPDDLDPDREVSFDRRGLHEVLERLVEYRGLQLDWEQAEALPDPVYVDAFAMNLPLPDEEKQALLEAEDVDARAHLLAGLANMVLSGGGESTSIHAH
ncbi:MAG: LON peptidase substrate-binding domain-containing protein [Gammaproteobacteria bacterium]|nr:LON peptidase substrate-binding domain-containing protein [Gammaproteobacteria bacterium]